MSVARARASIRLEDAGVHFEFDGLRRVLTPTLRKIRRIRDDSWGLRHIDLEVEPGEGIALIGPTGSGKTTALRVVAGVIPPSEGSAETRGRVGPLLATGAGVAVFLTGRENAELLGVLMGLSHAETRARIDEVAANAKIGDAFDRPVHTYSEGMRARLGLAVIQLVEPEILLLDEVFEALDHEFRARVEEYGSELRAAGGIVIAAGHDHEALARMAPRAVWLSRGEVAADGPIDEVIPRYREAVSRAAGVAVAVAR